MDKAASRIRLHANCPSCLFNIYYAFRNSLNHKKINIPYRIACLFFSKIISYRANVGKRIRDVALSIFFISLPLLCE